MEAYRRITVQYIIALSPPEAFRFSLPSDSRRGRLWARHYWVNQVIVTGRTFELNGDPNKDNGGELWHIVDNMTSPEQVEGIPLPVAREIRRCMRRITAEEQLGMGRRYG